jgi:hypothetical protein
MTAVEVTRIGKVLFGERFQVELAGATGLSLRQMHYLVAGERTVTSVTAQLLRKVVERRLEEIAALAADLGIDRAPRR